MTKKTMTNDIINQNEYRETDKIITLRNEQVILNCDVAEL